MALGVIRSFVFERKLGRKEGMGICFTWTRRDFWNVSTRNRECMRGESVHSLVLLAGASNWFDSNAVRSWCPDI